jgi:hypothetical protein
VVTSAAAGGVPTGRADTVRELMPVVPSPARVFHMTDELTIYAECYDNLPAQPHSIDLTVSILNDAGKAIFSQHEDRSSADLQKVQGRLSYAARIPLSSLTPGEYVVRFEAASRAGAGEPVSRDVQFRVEP